MVFIPTIPQNVLLLVAIGSAWSPSTAAYTVQNRNAASSVAESVVGAPAVQSSRRNFFAHATKGFAATAVLSLGSGVPPRALAAEGAANMQDVYFGAGCYWHVQHEFVQAEREKLGRKDNELTSLTGYAGGTKTDEEGRVCYHNMKSIADYGKFGHGEVVGMKIPESSIGDFAVEYFKLFGEKGERADPMDKGGEYRSLLGLPGGMNHPSYGQVESAAKDRGMTLVAGNGNDPDTLGQRLVYVMDSTKYPFYQAEYYHQYHNDFLSPAYSKEYNSLAEAALDDGRIKITGCPDRL